jgi:hypothetical protein
MKNQDAINEKISWQSILLALGLTYTAVSNYGEFGQIKSLYQEVNSAKAPSKGEKEKIDSIRSEMIEIVKKSNIFNKFNKPFIIDSLKNIEIVISDSPLVDKNALAIYMSLYGYAGSNSTSLSGFSIGKYIADKEYKPKKENIIIIGKKAINQSNFYETLTHELYHYFDQLLGDKSNPYSKKISLNEIKDKNISSKEHRIEKLSLVMFGVKPEVLKETSINAYDFCISYNKELIDAFGSVDYLQSSSELFARIKTMKAFLLKNGIINDINQDLKKSDLEGMYFKFKVNTENKGVKSLFKSEESLSVLNTILLIDLNKLDVINKSL